MNNKIRKIKKTEQYIELRDSEGTQVTFSRSHMKRLLPKINTWVKESSDLKLLQKVVKKVGDKVGYKGEVARILGIPQSSLSRRLSSLKCRFSKEQRERALKFLEEE